MGKIGDRQRDFLSSMSGIGLGWLAGDRKVAESLARRGYLEPIKEGSGALRITAAGLRAVADEIDAGRMDQWRASARTLKP